MTVGHKLKCPGVVDRRLAVVAAPRKVRTLGLQKEGSHNARHGGSLPPRASSKKAPSLMAAAEQMAGTSFYHANQIVSAKFKLLSPEQEARRRPFGNSAKKYRRGSAVSEQIG